MLLLFAAWHAAGILFAADTNLLLAVFILVWVADTAAYFGGRRLGQNALAPTISPGKTREGFLVALAAVFLCAGAATWLFPDIPAGLVVGGGVFIVLPVSSGGFV